MFSSREIKLDEDIDWDKLLEQSKTATFFQTREWLRIWLKHFPVDYKIFGVFEGEELIGITPFEQGRTLKGPTLISLGTSPVLGGELVSDFGDIIAKTGREKEVWKTIIINFQFSIFNFQFIREDSPSFKILEELGGKVEEIDVAPYIDLPRSWEEYLASLDRHDRHELRRKMRKLEEGVVSKGEFSDIDEFFRLMEGGNEQKRNFLKKEMRGFFQDIIAEFLPKEMLEMLFLEYEGKKIAAVLFFIFRNEVLLYNSGFDSAYSHLSPGLVLKAYMIKESIEKDRKRLDFLRGGERYKYDLGGKERKLYKIIIK